MSVNDPLRTSLVALDQQHRGALIFLHADIGLFAGGVFRYIRVGRPFGDGRLVPGTDATQGAARPLAEGVEPGPLSFRKPWKWEIIR
jgi:hypothetical protein